MVIQEIPISDLKPAEYNPRSITGDEFAGLVQSLTSFGLVDPIVVNADMTIIGGHQRVKAWQTLGHDTAPCIVLNLDKHQEMKLNVMLNSQQVSGKYDQPRLDIILQELQNDPDYLELRMDKLESMKMKKLGQDDDFTVPLDPKYTIEKGDVYLLGEHKAMCGDSTDENDVKMLMGDIRADMVFTDPPYNVDYEGKTKKKLKIKNDKKDDDTFLIFLTNAFKNMSLVTKLGGAIYVCHADSEGYNFRKAFKDAGYLLKQCIIWNKNSMVMGRQDYQWKHEPILYGWKEGASHSFYGGRSQTTVWDMDRPTRSQEHPTMKPIELVSKAVLNSSKEGDIVLDLFGGSGSTLITCEQMNRSCRTMEIDPFYMSVIIERWEALTGLLATKA